MKRTTLQSVSTFVGTALIVVSVTASAVAAESDEILAKLNILRNIREQVYSGLIISGGPKQGVIEYYEDTGVFPSDNTMASLHPPEQIKSEVVSSVRVEKNGHIVVTYGIQAHPDIAGKTLYLIPSEAVGEVNWRCTSLTIHSLYLPDICK